MKVKLAKVVEVAAHTNSYYWTVPYKLDYLPGQYFYFTLPRLKYPDNRGPVRQFTLSSSPTEKDYIVFTTRMSTNSGYKKTLSTLKIGSVVEADGPNGVFAFDKTKNGSHVMIAGGISVTPFRSFIKYAQDVRISDASLYLLISASGKKAIPFYTELKNWEEKYDNFKLAATLTKNAVKGWKGLTGRINSKMINQLARDWRLDNKKTNWWLTGTPDMVNNIESLLDKIKVPAGKIMSEKFTGYI